MWTRNEDLRKVNNPWKQLTYSVDGFAPELTEDNARGSLEQVRVLMFPCRLVFLPYLLSKMLTTLYTNKCLDIFNYLEKVKTLVVELPPTIELDDRLFRFITKGSINIAKGQVRTVVKNADGEKYVFEYENGELRPPKDAPTFLEVEKKEQWKLYEFQESTGNELGHG